MDGRYMSRELGKAVARKLMARLADIDAAENLSQVRVGHPHLLKGDMRGRISIKLDKKKRLVMEIADEPLPVLNDGGLDLAEVRTVRVVFIGDYHG